MSKSLTEALASVELTSGRTYTCQVRGLTVEVRVLAKEPPGGTNPPLAEEANQEPPSTALFPDRPDSAKPTLSILSTIPSDDDLEDE